MKILITGASSGIGRELAKQLVKDGHVVWGVARRENLLNDLKKELGDLFFYTAGDVSMENQVLAAYQEMKRMEFSPEIIILAAGAFLKDIGPELKLNYEIFKKTVDINLYGALNFIDVFLPRFLQKHSGQFIAISSTTALKPSLRGIGYPASKAAIGIAFRGLALAYRKQNVNFSTIYLGPVATKIWDAKKSFVVSDKEKIASIIIKKVMKTKKSVYYIPFRSTFMSRLSILPDRWYIALTELFR